MITYIIVDNNIFLGIVKIIMISALVYNKTISIFMTLLST